MKKWYILFFLFFFGFSIKTFASAGYARDGFSFLMILSGFLLLFAGVFWLAGFLKEYLGRMISRLLTQ